MVPPAYLLSKGSATFNASIDRSYTVAMGHRLPNHKGKCRNYHGHTWHLIFYIQRTDNSVLCLDGAASDHGMVADFGDVDAIIEPVVSLCDHAMYLNEKDPMVPLLEQLGSRCLLTANSPTSEALGAELLAAVQGPLNAAGLRCVRVMVSESPRSSALIDNV